MDGEILALVPLPDVVEGFEAAFGDDPAAWLPGDVHATNGGGWAIRLSSGRMPVPAHLHVGPVSVKDAVVSRPLAAVPERPGHKAHQDRLQPAHGAATFSLIEGVLSLRSAPGSASLVFTGAFRGVHAAADARRDAYGAMTRLLSQMAHRLEEQGERALTAAKRRHPSAHSRIAL